MSAKRPNSAIALGSKKPCLQHAFRCPTPDCNKSSKSLIGLRQHFSKSPKYVRFQTSKNRRKAAPVVQPLLVALPEANEYPWDDEDSLDELDETANENFVEDDNNPSGAPNNQAGMYSESANKMQLWSLVVSALPPKSITELTY